jgi:glycosyltransferase involved in cell wall biosynthesis
MVSRHLPDAAGTAAGRALHALGEGLVSDGHDLAVWSWAYESPERDLPAWCRWALLPGEPALRTRVRALVRPRTDVVRAGWQPRPDGDVVVADDPVSFAAVADHPTSILTVHYSTRLDAVALRDLSPRLVQDVRAERSFARRAAGVVAYSSRVADAVGPHAVPAPIGCPMPASVLPLVDEPVAACLADWTWAPNRRAAGLLLAAWPLVRLEVPGARLVLAGRGSEAFDARALGVEGRGRVADATEVLAEAAVLVFPCPPTSGPKVKVLEAMAVGLPVVTTPAGGEGIAGVDGVPSPPVALAPARPAAFAAAVVRSLRDPARRAAMAADGRALVLSAHAPVACARARIAAWSAALGDR